VVEEPLAGAYELLDVQIKAFIENLQDGKSPTGQS
jgi:hypothetical protein